MNDSTDDAKRTGGRDGEAGSDDENQPSRRARLVAGGIAIAALASYLVACVVLDSRRGDAPAHVTTKVRAAPDVEGDPVVLVEVENAGDVTAENVLVRVEGSGGPDADPVEEPVDFLAPGELTEFTLPLTKGATAADVTAAPIAWVDAG